MRPHTPRGFTLVLSAVIRRPSHGKVHFRSQHLSQILVFPVSSFWSFHYSSCISRLSLFLPFRKMCLLNILQHHLSRPFGRDVNHHVMRIISSDRLFARSGDPPSVAFYTPQFRRGSMAMNSLSRGQMSYMGQISYVSQQRF